MRRRWVILSILAFSLMIAGMVLAEGAPGIGWWVIGGGGGSLSAGDTSLDGTIGQWVVGSNTVGNIEVSSGFWSGGESSPPVNEPGLYLPLVLHEG